MTTYTGRVIRETGGCVLRLASGASLNFDTGAKLGGNPTLSGRPVYEGGLDVSIGQSASIPASGLRLATDVAASAVLGVHEVLDMGNGVKLFLARTQNAPSAAGSPGSLIIRLPGTGTPASAAGMYIKQGDNSPASAGWQVVQTGASAG